MKINYFFKILIIKKHYLLFFNNNYKKIKEKFNKKLFKKNI